MDSSIIFYLISISITLFCIFIYDFSNFTRGKKCCWILILIYLIFLIGFRYKVGGDTLTYMSWFHLASDLNSWQLIDIKSPFEPGFTLLVAIAKSINPNDFYILQLIHATIFNLMLFYFISANTKYRFSALLFSFLIYYIYFSTEILRESISVFIFTLNINSFINQKWLKYYSGIILCMFFHFSASFLLLLPLFRNIKFNKSFLSILFIVILFGIGLKQILPLLNNIPGIGSRIESYNKNDFAGYLWAALRFLQYSVVPFLALFFSHKSLHKIPKYEFAYLILILLGFGVIFNPVIFSRFANYFIPLYSLSLAELICSSIRNLNINHKLIGLTLSFLSFFSYGSYYMHLNFYERWLPYSSIFNPHDYSFRSKFANGGKQ